MTEPEEVAKPGMRELLGLAASKLPKPVRYRAQNALLGFERALLLIDTDREMASFRAITAEEEAASALFNALKLRKYPGAEKLNLGNHRHKAALGPFLHAVRASLSDAPIKNAQVIFDAKAPSVHLHFPLSDMGVVSPPGLDYHVTLEEPLDVHSTRAGEPGPYLFDAELKALVTATQSSSIARMVAKQANDRNTLLYASDGALPKSRATVETITARRDGADLAIFLAIAILQTPTLQSLAMRALEAFLGVIGQELDQPMPYPADPDSGVEVEINLQTNSAAQVLFTPKPPRPAKKGKPS